MQMGDPWRVLSLRQARLELELRVECWTPLIREAVGESMCASWVVIEASASAVLWTA
jgi:hypothetical protein